MNKNKKRLYNEYKDIWECRNPSGATQAMRVIVCEYLTAHAIPYEIDKAGNVLAGDFTRSAPCLVAHMDSVHADKPKNVICSKKGNLRASNGIGGDDKCGIVALLELLPTRPSVNAIFTVDEESGAQGARAVDVDKLTRVEYFIEIDRRGNSDLIVDISGAIASEDFISRIDPLRARYGFKEDYGMFTDIDIFLDSVFISAINLSAGYYNPHTKEEFVKLPELENTIKFAGAILDSVKGKQYGIDPREFSFNNYGAGAGAYGVDAYDGELDLLQQEAFSRYGAEVVELVTDAYYMGQESARIADLDYITE